MTADIRLTDDAVVIDGALSSGTEFPKRPVHVEGAEIHSGGKGGGFSFADRGVTGLHENPAGGQRWVWYAQNGSARLWSSGDAVTVRRTGGSFTTEIAGSVRAGELDTDLLRAERVDIVGLLEVDGTAKANQLEANRVTSNLGFLDDLRSRVITSDLLSNATLRNVRAEGLLGVGATGESVIGCRANALALNDPAAPTVIKGPITELGPQGAGDPPSAAKDPNGPGPGPKPEPQHPIPPRLALFHEFGPGKDRLVMNRFGRYSQGVHVEGNLTATGTINQASSITVKSNVRALDPAAALTALEQLNPVTYRYTDDSQQTQHVGFIAEDVPDLVAQPGRDQLSAMDIVGVLTAAVQEQQRLLTQLTAELVNLRRAVAA